MAYSGRRKLTGEGRQNKYITTKSEASKKEVSALSSESVKSVSSTDTADVDKIVDFH